MKTRVFFLIVALQVGVLVALSVRQELILARGETVLLETVPVDPRDLLRGDYVILRYKISNLPNELWDAWPPGPLDNGLPVFVSLVRRGEFHEAAQVSRRRPAPQPDRVVFQGHISDVWNASVVVTYGLERYYVKEGTGNPRGKLTVEASVSRDGTPRIKQVFLDGKPYAATMKEQSR